MYVLKDSVRILVSAAVSDNLRRSITCGQKDKDPGGRVFLPLGSTTTVTLQSDGGHLL